MSKLNYDPSTGSSWSLFENSQKNYQEEDSTLNRVYRLIITHPKLKAKQEEKKLISLRLVFLVFIAKSSFWQSDFAPRGLRQIKVVCFDFTPT
jgi:hypothetical protein